MKSVLFIVLLIASVVGVSAQQIPSVSPMASSGNILAQSVSFKTAMAPHKNQIAAAAVAVPVAVGVGTLVATNDASKALTAGGLTGIAEFLVYVAVHNADVLGNKD